eukprot:CAMPEP_0117750478 /NCGR_PEP_ID=MMETSP0947-20121206/10399_1 /TAXON_ID=44440 /ORGANISM="Chattonella subsalsa, Strain CCMP2191" /LENGTH=1004 /DNA_ID=CAMNT_0005568667 /DNA_START=84 /DNA_END=3098 /DNA_ORIENTATION=+
MAAVAQSLADFIKENDESVDLLLQRLLTKGSLGLLVVGEDGIDSTLLRKEFTSAASTLKDHFKFLHYCSDVDSSPQAKSKAEQIMHFLQIDFSQTVLLLIDDGNKYLSEHRGSPAPTEIAVFFKSFLKGNLKEWLKSEDRSMYPNDKDKLIPNVYRATAESFGEIVLANEDLNVFIQEFADWCPYCVKMHPYTNDLAWVISPVKNVRLVKIDNSSNETKHIDDFLRCKGIPNIVFLKASEKKAPPAQHLKFGERGEGRVPELKVEDMVEFIHKNMDGKKFDIHEFKMRAKHIQGQEGFLSLKCPLSSGTNRWIDELLKKQVVREGDLADIWKKAFKKAVMYDDVRSRNDAVTAVELVEVKMMHRLSTTNIPHDKAKEMMEKAKELVEQTKSSTCSSQFCDEDEDRRCVKFELNNLQILSIDTTGFAADVAFKLKLLWGLRKTDLLDDDKETWQPPKLFIQNGSLFPDTPNINSSPVKFYKDGKWRAEMTTEVQCRISEVFELENFPFDVQPLSIKISFEPSDEDWELTGPINKCAIKYSNSIGDGPPEWQLHPPVCEIFSQHFGSKMSKTDMHDLEGLESDPKEEADIRPALMVTAIAERNWKQFLWRVQYIVCLLALCGNFAFVIPSDDLSGRLGVYLTCFLASVAFQTVIDGTLPQMSYVSFAQVYLILMNLLLFVGMIFAAIQTWFGDQLSDTMIDENGDEVERDFVGSITSSSFFLCMNLILFIVIHLGFFVSIKFYRRPLEHKKFSYLNPRIHMQPLMLDDHHAEDFHYEREISFETPVLKDVGRDAIRVYASRRAHETDDVVAERVHQAQLLAEDIHNKLTTKILSRTSSYHGATKSKMHEEMKTCDAEEMKTCDDEENLKCPGQKPLQFEEDIMCSAKPDFGDSGYAWWSKGGSSANTKVSIEDVKTLWMKVFEMIDTDNDGNVDSHELEQVEEKMALPLKEIMHQADIDNDGLTSRNEWSQLMEHYLKNKGLPTAGTMELMTSFATRLSSAKGKKV